MNVGHEFLLTSYMTWGAYGRCLPPCEPYINYSPLVILCQMPSWFDIRGLDPKSEEDAAGIESAANAVKSLVEAEIAAGVPADRIVIGGFSQGGAAAIYSALTMEKDIGAVVLLSTWLPLHQRFPGAAKANLTTPILQCHGKADPIVPFQWGKLTSAALAALNDKHR